MKISKRFITQTVIYKDHVERDKHIKSMKTKGYTISNMGGHIVTYKKDILVGDKK